MQSVKHAVTSVVQRGRIGRKKSFVLALALALFVLPVATALAYYGATGSGTVGGNVAGTSASVVTLQPNTPSRVYAGPSTTDLMPGGTVAFQLAITCTAGSPCTVPSITLQSWSSTKPAPCDPTDMPNSFVIQSQSATFPITVTAPTVDTSDTVTILWNNLATVNQTPCAGGTFTFTLNVP